MTEDDTFARRLRRIRSMPRPVRIVMARPRFFFAIAIGLIAIAILPSSLRLATRLLISWDISMSLYLLLACSTAMTTGLSRIRHNAAMQDDGRFGVLFLTAAGAFATLGAIFTELSPDHRGGYEVALALTTIALSWSAIHTTFALHYAHEYYRDESGGLAFPGDQGEKPDYWDFVYFSFVIGMTAQVSDVGITDKMIRRTATVHGIVSFVFNTALLALTINIVAGAV